MLESRCRVKIFIMAASWILEPNDLNLHVAPMPPTKFQLKLTQGLGGDGLKNFKMAAKECKYLSNSEPPSPKCLPQSFDSIRLTIRSRSGLKVFEMVAMATILDVGKERILVILNLHVSSVPPNKFWLTVPEQILFEDF